MAAVVPIIRLLPAILKLFPHLKETKLIKGLVIPINNVNEMTDAEALRALQQKLKLKQKKKFNDNAHVVKVSDVKKCIEDSWEDTTVVKEFAVSIASQLLSGVTAENIPSAPISQKIIDCVREKALKQTAKRKRITYRYPKREI